MIMGSSVSVGLSRWIAVRATTVAASALRPNGSADAMDEIAQALDAIDIGQPRAANELLPLVYDELVEHATLKLARERPGQTLDATALVHEAYVRLVGGETNGSPRASDPVWANRRHFFAAVSEAMRRILVENARRKAREKHGGRRRREYTDLDALSAAADPQDTLDLYGALQQLALHDPFKAKLVELRFFAGLTLEQAASFLKVSLSTADRAWRHARCWLRAALAGGDSQPSGSPAGRVQEGGSTPPWAKPSPEKN
jgi:RNA polymerase sigma factor (TIGR02999 family)